MDPYFDVIDDVFYSSDEEPIKYNPRPLSCYASSVVRGIAQDCSIICGQWECYVQYIKAKEGWVRLEFGGKCHQFLGSPIDDILGTHPQITRQDLLMRARGILQSNAVRHALRYDGTMRIIDCLNFPQRN